MVWADRRFKLGHGRVMALYVMAYTAGRGWIEMLRIDTVEYEHVLGLRLNVWTSIVLFCLAAVYFVVVGRRRPGRETEVYTEERLAVTAQRLRTLPGMRSRLPTPRPRARCSKPRLSPIRWSVARRRGREPDLGEETRRNRPETSHQPETRCPLRRTYLDTAWALLA